MTSRPFAKTTLVFAITVASAAAVPSAAWAACDHCKGGADKVQGQALAQATGAASDMTDGEVRKVDKEGGRVTLKHADIKSLDMPGMTMVFSVRDKALLDAVKTGDKVRFKAVNEAGKFTVTEIQVVQ